MAEESKTERGLATYASKRGWYCRKWVSPSRRGVPDHIFIAPDGVVWFLEFKAKGKKPTPMQEREIRLIKSNHANARVIDCLDDGKRFVDIHTPKETTRP